MYLQDIQNVTPAQTRQGILGTDYGQGGAMDMVHRLLILEHQVRIFFDDLSQFRILLVILKFRTKCFLCHNLTISSSNVGDISGGGGGGFYSSGRSGKNFNGPRDMVERVVRDFYREGSVGDHRLRTSMVGLAEEVELGERKEEEEEEEEDTLAEAVGKDLMMPVGVVVDPTMLETISRMNVVTTTLAMVR